jgi:hypothetical protein
LSEESAMANSAEAATVSAPSETITYDKRTLLASIVVGGQRHDIYFRVWSGLMAHGSEQFLATALLPAMVSGATLRLAGGVSPRLLEHLPTYQNVLRSWYPDLSYCSVEATAGDADSGMMGRGVGSFFSGGVDSFYTARSHGDELTHLIFIRGFDVPVAQTEAMETAQRAVSAAAVEMGKHLIVVETNARTLLDRYADWGHQGCGAVLGAVALLLSPQLRKVYIPSSMEYADLVPWGSHPTLDPLWSTEKTEIIYDVTPTGRMQRLAAVAQNETALRWLRVCWQNLDGVCNCGVCEKCLRTMLMLQVEGALESCETLPHRIDYERVADLALPGYLLSMYQDILRRAIEHGDEDVAASVRACLHGAQDTSASVNQEERLSSRVKSLQRELQQVYTSRSWRMTAPLRALGAAVQRRPGGNGGRRD